MKTKLIAVLLMLSVFVPLKAQIFGPNGLITVVVTTVPTTVVTQSYYQPSNYYSYIGVDGNVFYTVQSPPVVVTERRIYQEYAPVYYVNPRPVVVYSTPQYHSHHNVVNHGYSRPHNPPPPPSRPTPAPNRSTQYSNPRNGHK